MQTSVACSEPTLPIVIDCLKEHLGNAYKDEDWKPAFDAVFNAEGDFAHAQEAIHNLATANQLPKLTIKIPACMLVRV